MKTFDELFKISKLCVEASRFERLSLWKEYHKSHKWEESREGKLLTLGEINSRPICVSISIDIIDGLPVIFFEPTSELVDYKLIDDFFNREKYRYKTDAMNFHNILHTIYDIKKEIGCISDHCYIQREQDTVILYDIQDHHPTLIKKFSSNLTDDEIFAYADKYNHDLIEKMHKDILYDN
ncbi:MAG: hypothetical protein PHC28_14990 [Flavobacterium sp.]|uniref:hypothetical protein n=1 Tax=Flavobacterium sp. TaxID=239 RepID=UPI00263A122C|nr:hypothetical protein [Flavobacterium sp.]MDD5151759.1 hypothetical protein [Flavobacterium sp.]